MSEEKEEFRLSEKEKKKTWNELTEKEQDEYLRRAGFVSEGVKDGI